MSDHFSNYWVSQFTVANSERDSLDIQMIETQVVFYCMKNKKHQLVYFNFCNHIIMLGIFASAS